MLTEIILVDLSPRPASCHIANQSAERADSPAGDSGTVGLGAVGTVAQAGRSALTEWRRARLAAAVERGEVVKLTGPRSIATPGGDAA